MKKLAWLLTTAFVCFASTQTKADDCQGAMSATINSMGDAINYGKAVGNNCKGQTAASVVQNNAAAVAQSIDANQSNYASSQYYGRDLNVSLQAGNSKISKCSGDLTGLSNKDKADCEAVEFAAKNGHQRPKYSINADKDNMIAASERQMNQANISSDSNYCRVVRNVIPATYEKKQCFSTTTRTTQQEQCSDTVSAQCNRPTANYDTADGGIEMNSLKVLLGEWSPTFRYTNKVLRYRQVPHNSTTLNAYGGTNRVFLSKLEFTIEKLDEMPSAKIVRIYQDNGLKLYINGTKVWDKWYGTDNYGTSHPNLDIKPFLKEGKNIIDVDLHNRGGPSGLEIDIAIPVYNNCRFAVKSTCSARQKSPKICQVVANSCEREDRGNGFLKETGSLVGQPALGYCQKRNYTLSCTNERVVSECSSLDTKGCEQIGSECTERDSQGNCLAHNQTYQCKKTEERVVETTQCEQKLCNGDNCIGEPPLEADGDFGKAIAIMEAQRQAGVYGKTPTGYNIFDGDPSVCSVKVLAGHSVMSCCKEISTGNKFQNRTQGGFATQTYGNTPNQPNVDARGSQYIYDNVFDQNKTLAVIQSTATLGWLQCNNEEKVLAIKRGSGLCEYSHEWCSKKTFFGSCIEKKRQYCCYRSTLARIINQQGRVQLGKGAGCDGFTLEELQKLDFSKMDFSEFINEVIPADIDIEQRKRTVQKTVEQNFGKQVNYYDR